jgi:phage/plasmid-like protein (TIGR03299 family)
MSKESLATLNTSTLIGNTTQRGKAWHWRAEDQGEESNHYPGMIPVDDVHRRLFNWQAIEGVVSATAITDDGVLIGDASSFKAIMHSETGHVFGIPKQGYTPHQYGEWLVETVERIDTSTIGIASAGVLKQGGQAWVQFEHPENRTATCKGAEPFPFRAFLSSATSHDGSLATTFFTGNQAIVCDNSMSVALSLADEKFKVRHSANSLSRIDDARIALGLIERQGDAFEAQFERLAAEVVSFDRWREFVAKITWAGPTPSARAKTIAQNKAEDLHRLWQFDPRVAPWQGSEFGVLAAVNTWENHYKTVKGATRVERNQARTITGDFEKADVHALKILASV